uniref:CARD domain-containing protein n=1 Tax=Plectus sambesii TaxID=2011161 RepID=A0A914W383_9BILA
MDKLKQKAIKSHNADLVKIMEPLPVIDYLPADLLTDEQIEKIRNPHSLRPDNNRELIAILYRKREELQPFESFIEALKNTGDNHEAMAKHIQQTYVWPSFCSPT